MTNLGKPAKLIKILLAKKDKDIVCVSEEWYDLGFLYPFFCAD